jgi:hypothetical protein
MYRITEEQFSEFAQKLREHSENFVPEVDDYDTPNPADDFSVNVDGIGFNHLWEETVYNLLIVGRLDVIHIIDMQDMSPEHIRGVLGDYSIFRRELRRAQRYSPDFSALKNYLMPYYKQFESGELTVDDFSRQVLILTGFSCVPAVRERGPWTPPDSPESAIGTFLRSAFNLQSDIAQVLGR